MVANPSHPANMHSVRSILGSRKFITYIQPHQLLPADENFVDTGCRPMQFSILPKEHPILQNSGSRDGLRRSVSQS